MADLRDSNRDLVLAPGEFAYVLDTTKGLINVNVGPYKTSMAGTDQPVIWDKKELRFVRCELEKAIQRDMVAPEGFYLALLNPAAAEKDAHPTTGRSSPSADLSVGHRVNIPGPANFPLWPGQMADVIRGHHLRSNQYLLAQVYNDTEASANWKKAVVKPAGDAQATTPTPTTFAPGQLMVIKGTEVAFFIPPTGIKVVPEGDKFVREAVTLERLEYCILLDEDGNKRFVQGPAVVFPEPTETFVSKTENGTSVRKFLAIELNETTGIYVKVIADYTDDVTGEDHKVGDELFITGKTTAIYFQREEHSVIRYEGQTKHYAVAIPAGEGRYVLNRQTGVIRLVEGPDMLLCDPRHEVIVRRVLSKKAVELYYPGNTEAITVNAQLEAQTATPDTSQYAAGRTTNIARAMMSSASYSALNAMDEVAQSSRQLAGDTFARGSKFTPPRTITLDTKYEGAVAINVWPGYAVLVVDKSGHRRVVVGPDTILLEYDESLAPMSLSTGKPKNDDKRLETVYLRVSNNSVSDIVAVETKDLVAVNVSISYRVNFEGADQQRWFSVENYIGLMCDHLRSLIRNTVKRKGIEEFYANAIDIIRDTVLGASTAGVGGASLPSRPGRVFTENGMRVYDVEVTDVKINNPNVAKLLGEVQQRALASAVGIAEQERELAITLRSEDVKRKKAVAVAETEDMVSVTKQQELKAQLAVELLRVANQAKVDADKLAAQTAESEARQMLTEAEIARQKAVDDATTASRAAEIELEIKSAVSETEQIVKRAGAVDEKLSAALVTLSDQKMVADIASSLAPMAAMYNISTADVLGNLLKDTPFESVLKALGTRAKKTSATT